MKYMRYIIIGFSLIFGVSFLLFGIMNGFGLALEGNYLLAIMASWFNFLIGVFLTVAGYTMYKNTKENKYDIDSIDKESVEPTIKSKKYALYIISGFWLSVPLAGFSIYINLADIQQMVMLSLLPIIIGLPWSIPGSIVMLGAGLMHGGSEVGKMFFFFLGGFLVFISVSINGANIYSLLKNKNGKGFDKTLILHAISAVTIIFLVSYFTLMNKQIEEGREIDQYLIDCGNHEIVTRKFSPTKVYYGDKKMGRENNVHYLYMGELKDNTITIYRGSDFHHSTYNMRKVECLENTTKFELALTDKYLTDN